MRSSLREILIQSHVADVAIAVLLLGALEFGFQALCLPLWRIAIYLFTAIAILGIPYSSPGVNLQDRFMLVSTASFLLASLTNLGAAWILARWAYELGPVKILARRVSEFRGNFA